MIRIHVGRMALAAMVSLPFVAATGVAMAGSQSSNSSSNCSSGRCTQVETYISEDERGSYGYSQTRRWREPSYRSPRRERDDDDD